MRLLSPVIVVALTLAAGPALACSSPSSLFSAAFLERPASAPAGRVLHGRLVVRGGSASSLARDASDLYLFGVMERRGRPPVRLYRSRRPGSCDITPRELFGREAWIVGRPLPDDGAGERVLLLVLRRSGVWGVE
jgi:hypothetical protein